MDKYGLIMAAGKGTRMKSTLPKVLHKVCNKEMINHIIDVLRESDVSDINVIVGYCGDQVKAATEKKNVSYSFQDAQLGTGHAVKCSLSYLKDKKGAVTILSGDCPMITKETINAALDFHEKEGCAVTIVSSYTEKPHGYGRIVRDKDNFVDKIVEQKDCSEAEAKITEINSGTYIFDIEKLIKNIYYLNNQNVQKEYYLTDMIQILKDKNLKIGAISAPYEEIIGVNSMEQLDEVENILKNRK